VTLVGSKRERKERRRSRGCRCCWRDFEEQFRKFRERRRSGVWEEEQSREELEGVVGMV
jgi:hypothetical protein